MRLLAARIYKTITKNAPVKVDGKFLDEISNKSFNLKDLAELTLEEVDAISKNRKIPRENNEEGTKNLVRWRFDQEDPEMTSLFGNMNQVDDLKDIKIEIEEDDETIRRKVFIYVERADNPCFGKNDKPHQNI